MYIIEEPWYSPRAGRAQGLPLGPYFDTHPYEKAELEPDASGPQLGAGPAFFPKS